MITSVDMTEMVITLQNGKEYRLPLGENSYPEPHVLPRLDGNVVLYTDEKKTNQINTVTELIACALFAQGDENLPFKAAVSIFSFLLGRITPKKLKMSLVKFEMFEAISAMATATEEDIAQIKMVLENCLQAYDIYVDLNDTYLVQMCETVLANVKSLADISKIEFRISAVNTISLYIPSDILCAERKDIPRRKSLFQCDNIDEITFIDKIFVFTGCRDVEGISKAYDIVWMHGGVIKDTFVAKTDYVVVNEEYEWPTMKYEKALEAKKGGRNITIVSVRRFFELSSVTSEKRSPFIIEKNKLKKYIGNESHVTIPEEVTEIGTNAFFGNTSVKSVVIPEGVTKIGTSAFCRCSSLKSVTLPNSLNKINNKAFSYCSSLTSVSIPSGVAKIPIGAFFMCVALESISLNEGLVEIGHDNFCDCNRLSEITLPSTLYRVRGFSNCSNLKKITFLGAPAHIGDIICNCSLEEITLPEGVKTFSVGSSIRKLSVPNTVESTGTDFRKCLYLSFNEYENGYYLGNDRSPYVVLAAAKSRDISKISIHPETKIIAAYAFEGCANISEVTIPSSIIRIETGAFKECDNLSKVVIPKSVERIGVHAFASCKNLSEVEAYCKPTAFDDSAFNDCYALADENGFCIIGTVLFYSYAEVRDVVIPDGVTKIGFFAFGGEDADVLESITIPKSVVEIDEGIFEGFRYLVIRGERGSYAEKYAKKNKIEFEISEPDASVRKTSLEDYIRLFSN